MSVDQFTVFDSPVKEWGGEWHGFESRVRELERLANELLIYPLVELRYTDLLGKLGEIHRESNPQQRTVLITQWQQKLQQTFGRSSEPDTNPTLAELTILAAQPNSPHGQTLNNVRMLYHHFHDESKYHGNKSFDRAQSMHVREFILQAAAQTLLYYGTFSLGFGRVLEVSPNFPPIHVNTTLMKQLSTDLRIGEQALLQRRRSMNNEVTWQGFGLYMADLLAYSAIKPLAEGEIIPRNSAAVTYMQERTDIRLIPYYNILYIGLPSAMINLYDKPPEEFLAIPHEIGHFLYDYGEVNTATGKKKISDVLSEAFPKSDWRSRWLEEIFADTFGCLMAGPINVVGFQQLLADGNPEHLLESDGHHPTPAIRPLLQTQILREIDRRTIATYKHSPIILDRHWQLHLDRYVGKLRGNVLLAQEFEVEHVKKTGQELLTALEPVVKKVLDLFVSIFDSGPNPLASWESWSSDIPMTPGRDTPGATAVGSFNQILQPDSNKQNRNEGILIGALRYEITHLQNDFAQFYFNGVHFRRNTIVPPPISEPRPQTPYQQTVQALKAKIAQHPKQADSPRIPVAEWIDSFVAPGWSTEGPEFDEH